MYKKNKQHEEKKNKKDKTRELPFIIPSTQKIN